MRAKRNPPNAPRALAGLRARLSAGLKARVLIRPKEGILDPQGQTVERVLPALGFKGASHVRVGRLVELEVEDPSELDAMCHKLLANPLIEDYEVDLGE
jgi:phosphoribosylformylglycinamidine synthase PurS subunit